MMDSIFILEIEGNLVIVYMDDILCFSDNLDDLIKIERAVLQKLRDNDLYLKPKKCEFRKTKVEYLVMIVKEGQISMDPVKLGGIRDWPTPTTVKEVRSVEISGDQYHMITHVIKHVTLSLFIHITCTSVVYYHFSDTEV